jgi:hypothetical protein
MKGPWSFHLLTSIVRMWNCLNNHAASHRLRLCDGYHIGKQKENHESEREDISVWEQGQHV